VKTNRFPIVFHKALDLLNETNTPCLLVGGLAVGIVGEPRVTNDADFIIRIDRKKLKTFLAAAKNKGFKFNRKVVQETFDTRGVFRLHHSKLHIDFIRLSIALEKSAFQRKNKIKIMGRQTYIPTPEDLILLKLMPGRGRDMLDVENIFIRHGRNLDIKYLEKWAMEICDEAEDLRVWNRLQKVMKKMKKDEEKSKE
jgi:hypothetical protein